MKDNPSFKEEIVLIYDARSGNRTRATLVEGACSHHCVIPAPRRVRFLSRKNNLFKNQREEDKLPLLNQQYVVYHFQRDLCDADCVCYMCLNLHQRVE